ILQRGTITMLRNGATASGSSAVARRGAHHITHRVAGHAFEHAALEIERPLAVRKAKPSLSRPSIGGTDLVPVEDMLAAGKALRDRVSRLAHGNWSKRAHHSDPIQILRAGDADRLPDLVPIRYGRMLQSPFAFYRGSAAIMAADLARTPVTGIRLQAC